MDDRDGDLMVSQSEAAEHACKDESQPVEKVVSEEEAKYTADLQMVLNAVLEVNSQTKEVQKETKERTRKMDEEFQRVRRSLRGESSKREEEALRIKRSLCGRSLKEELSEDGAEGLPSTYPPACAAEGGA